jgi:N-methylhydantoinase B
VSAVEAPALDAVTFSVVRHGLIAAARKAYTAFKRTGMLPLIYEGGDFAVSLFDDRLNLIAEAAALPLFAGALGNTVPRTVEEIGRDRLRPGDTLLTNIPYLHGSHPPDVVLIEPVFFEERPVAFVALRGHMGDLSGDSFIATSTTEVFQEGLLLPPLKLYDAGELNETVVSIVRANSRLPATTVGDFLAGAGALRAGTAALQALLGKHGTDTYYAVVDEILDHGERIARQGVERIPDGVYTAEGALDDNGVARGVPVPLRVTVTVEGSHMTIDTTGSAGQQAGPYNCPMAYTQAIARMCLKTLATPDIPSNGGEHRVVTVVAPEGTIFNPTPTAPSFLSAITTIHLAELILHALAPALPDEIPAMSGSDLGGVVCLLRHPRTGRYGVSMYVGGSGFGARRGRDGTSAIYARQASDLQTVPLEVLEARYPTIRVRYELDQDSGGPGRWRGGLGMVEEEEFLSDGLAAMTADKTSGASPIAALDGGRSPKRLNGVIFYYGSDHEVGPPSCKRSHLAIAPGDRYLSWTAGGGGFGDPLERDPELVARDVRDEYVSPASAIADYGVVLGPAGDVDAEATGARRAELRGGRR